MKAPLRLVMPVICRILTRPPTQTTNHQGYLQIVQYAIPPHPAGTLHPFQITMISIRFMGLTPASRINAPPAIMETIVTRPIHVPVAIRMIMIKPMIPTIRRHNFQQPARLVILKTTGVLQPGITMISIFRFTKANIKMNGTNAVIAIQTQLIFQSLPASPAINKEKPMGTTTRSKITSIIVPHVCHATLMGVNNGSTTVFYIKH